MSKRHEKTASRPFFISVYEIQLVENFHAGGKKSQAYHKIRHHVEDIKRENTGDYISGGGGNSA